uniref:Uncharacterized protein n=1 Tax=Sphaerodactylus townsendi TaxID=933632 RepID=A0ACB8ETA6_9SAUR
MPLAGTPAPNKKRKPTKLILELTQEVMPQEGSKLNLGKKISTPKDVMLEELSLLTNKGSKMFKLRQMRVEKFIYENNPDAFMDNSVENSLPALSSEHPSMLEQGYPHKLHSTDCTASLATASANTAGLERPRLNPCSAVNLKGGLQPALLIEPCLPVGKMGTVEDSGS